MFNVLLWKIVKKHLKVHYDLESKLLSNIKLLSLGLSDALTKQSVLRRGQLY